MEVQWERKAVNVENLGMRGRPGQGYTQEYSTFTGKACLSIHWEWNILVKFSPLRVRKNHRGIELVVRAFVAKI